MVFRPRLLITLFVMLNLSIFLSSCKRTAPSSGHGAQEANVDSDSDGIPDSLETNGFEIRHPDGTSEVLKSSPKHKDVYVFVAWMQDAEHSHKPDPDAMNAIVSSFANAPLTNPDGTGGIRLHIIYAHQPVPEVAMLGVTDSLGNYNWDEFYKIKSQVFPHQATAGAPPLEELVHFCLFAHDFSSEHYSGITRTLPGRDFIVSLGAFTNHVGTAAEQAGTFMHELGHDLGLHHGGFDDLNYKPNYISVMNYFFQLGGIQENGAPIYTYSSFKLDSDEHHLSDLHALTTDARLDGFGTQYFCPDKSSPSVTIFSISGPVDWKCDGQTLADLSSDVNRDAAISPLPGRSDWNTLQLALAEPNAGAGLARTATQSRELTAQEADRIKTFPVGGVSAKRTDDGITVSWKEKPLGQALSYTVLRKVGDGAVPAVIGRTDGASFVDVKPAAGKAEYYVSAIFAPHAFVAQQNTSLALPIGAKVLSSTIRLRLEKSPSELVDKFKSMGSVDSKPSTGQPFPKVLLQTDLSEPATVP